MKGVIVAGGYGTRFLPITKSIPKEMLPLRDMPILENIVKELSESGIKEILIVISENKKMIEEYFSRNIDYENFLIENNKQELLQKVRQQENYANISFEYQKKSAGFQDAISYAKKFVGDDDFVLCTGDQVFHNAGGKSCTEQLIEKFEELKMPIIVTHKEKIENLHKYGVMKFKDTEKNIVDKVIEKPKDKFPSDIVAVGRYLLPAKIFEYIAQNKEYVGKELNFSACLNMLAQNQGLVALNYEGVGFDTGSYSGYVDAFIYYSKI